MVHGHFFWLAAWMMDNVDRLSHHDLAFSRHERDMTKLCFERFAASALDCDEGVIEIRVSYEKSFGRQLALNFLLVVSEIIVLIV